MNRAYISSTKYQREKVSNPERDRYLSRMQGLREIISTVSSRGTFCTGGKTTVLPAPGLELQGIGPIAFPLLPSQIEVIKQVAKPAPFGKGFQTVIDATVRNTLQIEPSLIRMTNPRWHDSLQRLAEIAADELGVQAAYVQAHLYKLLIYEQGGHFRGHKDVEKELGMFATLVVQFPSEFCGGSLLFCHGGASKVLQMGSDDGSSKFDFHYAAHYADCQHEVREITSGTRMVAVYNLCWKADRPPPTANSMDTSIALSKHLNNITGLNGVLLEHQYTGSSLARYGIRALKGNDRAIADAVVAANDFMQDLTGTSPLALHIVRSKRIIIMENDGELIPPELDLQEGSIFCLDGAEPPEKIMVCHKSFKFYDDIINREFDDDECPSWPCPNDCFWKNCEGGEVHIYGNEGHGETTFYSCYVLTIFRKEHELQLFCNGDIGLALAEARNAMDGGKKQGIGGANHLLDLVKQCLDDEPCISLAACARGLEALLNMELTALIQPITVSVVESLTRTIRTQAVSQAHSRVSFDSAVFRKVSETVLRLGWDVMGKAVCELLNACKPVEVTLMARLDMLVRIFPLIPDKSMCEGHLDEFIRTYGNSRSNGILDVNVCRAAMELLFLFDSAAYISQLKDVATTSLSHHVFTLHEALRTMSTDVDRHCFFDKIGKYIDAAHAAWKGGRMDTF